MVITQYKNPENKWISRLYRIYNNDTVVIFNDKINKNELEDWLITNKLYLDRNNKYVDSDLRFDELENIFNGTSNIFGIEFCIIGKINILT